MSKADRIMIIGGGLGGLTAALALVQRGFKVTVHEQAPALGELGAGLTLPSTSMQTFDALGIWERIRDVSVHGKGMAFVHYQTLELLHGSHDPEWARKPTSPDQGAHAHRARVHAVLVQALQEQAPDAVRLGHRVTSVTQDEHGVHAEFENGDVDDADLLIAADGVRSTAFREVFGADNPAVFTGVVAIRCLIPVDDRIRPYLTGGRAMKFVGPKRGLNRYGVDDGKILNCVGLARTDSWTQEGWSHPCSREEFFEIFHDFHRDVLGLIENAPEGDIYKWALYSRAPLDSWVKGRVTILGDAAHPMLPYLGQGATAAIEDGLVLARALEAHDDYATAFKVYETERRERTMHQMRTSLQQGEALNRGPEEYNRLRPSQNELSGYDPRLAPV